MVVCVECLPADKPWDVVSVTHRSSGVAPRACVRVYARVLVPPNLYIHTYIIARLLILGSTRARLFGSGESWPSQAFHSLQSSPALVDHAATAPFICIAG